MRRMHEFNRQSLSLYVAWSEQGNPAEVTLGFNFLGDKILTGSDKQLAEQLHEVFGTQTVYCQSYDIHYQGGKIIGF